MRNEPNELLRNLDRLHTTELGAARIRKNLSLDTDDVVGWCKANIIATSAATSRRGKNWYVKAKGYIITINAYSNTIITAHKEKTYLENTGGVTMGAQDTFQDFLATVDEENHEFVSRLHQALTELGCKIDVKPARSGFVVSYSRNKKTIANYVFRKKGLVARIYTNHILQYMDVLDTLPDGMVRTIQQAPICKRLVNPAACNPKCAMGYDFILKGERLQRCRYSAFQFLLTEETKPFVKALLLREAEAAD